MAAFHWGFGNCFADPGDEPDDYPTRHAVDVDADCRTKARLLKSGDRSHKIERALVIWDSMLKQTDRPSAAKNTER